MSEGERDTRPSIARAERERSDRKKVAYLFGSAPDVILEAVGNFLARAPGALDHHSLRIVAAAAPHIRDPQLVAQLVNELPITGMFVAARDDSDLRMHFSQVLPRRKPRTRQRLVADLIRISTLDVLEFSPPERLTDNARALLEDHLLDLATGDQTDQARALSSPVATPRVVRAVLDTIDKKISRAEVGTAHRPPGKLPLRIVAGGLAAVFDRETMSTTADDIDRAWRLFLRCEADDGSFQTVLAEAAKSSKLNRAVGASILDMIDRHNFQAETGKIEWRRMARAHIASVPETPEDIARRAVVTGASLLDDSVSVDPRWLLLRSHAYGRRRAASLLPPMTSDRVDLEIAQLRNAKLSPSVIEKMRNGDALAIVSRRSSRLSDRALEALVDNDHMPGDVDLGTVRPRVTLLKLLSVESSGQLSTREHVLTVDPRKCDVELATIIRSASARTKSDAIRSTVMNPSAGPLVVRAIVESNIQLSELRSHLLYLASHTPSVETQHVLSTLATEILESSSSGSYLPIGLLNPDVGQAILDRLLLNGMLDRGVYDDRSNEPRIHLERTRRAGRESIYARGLLRPRVVFPDVGVYRIAGRYGYGPLDVARKVVDGSAPENRIDALVLATERRHAQGSMPQLLDAATLLADNGSLSDVHWWYLTNNNDQHAALRMATHPNCPPQHSAARLRAFSMASSSARAIMRGVAVPPDARLKRWTHLPNEQDVPFSLPSAALLLDGRVIGDRTLRLVRTRRRLDEVANQMGNCLKSYDKAIDSGTRVIATAGEGSDILAVAWEVIGTGFMSNTLAVSEINSRFNRRNVPDDFRQAITSLTQAANDGSLRAAENVPTNDGKGEEIRRRLSVRRPLVLTTDNSSRTEPLRSVQAPSVLTPIKPVTRSDGTDHEMTTGVVEHSELDTPDSGASELDTPDSTARDAHVSPEADTIRRDDGMRL